MFSEGFRGVAANWYRAGADGLFFWNLGTPLEGKSGQDLINTRKLYYGALPELGDAQTIKYEDKLFCLDDVVLSYYQHISSQSPLPVALSAKQAIRLSLEVADDLAAEKDRLENFKLILQFQGKVNEQDLLLELNGHELSQRKVVTHDDNQLTISANPEASMLNLGSNIIEASLKRSSLDAKQRSSSQRCPFVGTLQKNNRCKNPQGNRF